MPITFSNIVAVLDIGFSALNSIIYSWLPIGFLFGLIDLIEVDSFAADEIVKSVVIELLESVHNVLFRSVSCPIQVNWGNLLSLMSDDLYLCVVFGKLLLNVFETSSLTCWSGKNNQASLVIHSYYFYTYFVSRY